MSTFAQGAAASSRFNLLSRRINFALHLRHVFFVPLFVAPFHPTMLFNPLTAAKYFFQRFTNYVGGISWRKKENQREKSLANLSIVFLSTFKHYILFQVLSYRSVQSVIS